MAIRDHLSVAWLLLLAWHVLGEELQGSRIEQVEPPAGLSNKTEASFTNGIAAPLPLDVAALSKQGNTSGEIPSQPVGKQNDCNGSPDNPTSHDAYYLPSLLFSSNKKNSGFYSTYLNSTPAPGEVTTKAPDVTTEKIHALKSQFFFLPELMKNQTQNSTQPHVTVLNTKKSETRREKTTKVRKKLRQTTHVLKEKVIYELEPDNETQPITEPTRPPGAPRFYLIREVPTKRPKKQRKFKARRIVSKESKTNETSSESQSVEKGSSSNLEKYLLTGTADNVKVTSLNPNTTISDIFGANMTANIDPQLLVIGNNSTIIEALRRSKKSRRNKKSKKSKTVSKKIKKVITNNGTEPIESHETITAPVNETVTHSNSTTEIHH